MDRLSSVATGSSARVATESVRSMQTATTLQQASRRDIEPNDAPCLKNRINSARNAVEISLELDSTRTRGADAR